MLNDLISICWDITSRCNDNCKYCYRNSNNSDLDIESNKIILKKLLSFGVKKISFVGGEPLLYNDLIELVKYGREIDTNNTIFSITTNAIILCDYDENQRNFYINENLLSQITEFFNWITFSLDASDSITQTIIGRNKLHFDRICYLLNYFMINNIDKKIKINTVVNKLNMNELEKLYDLLLKYNVNRWKLFKFLPSRERALKNKTMFDITDYEFNNCVSGLLNSKDVYNDNIKISINNYEDFNKSYITISSEGMLIVYDGSSYNKKLNLLKDDINDITKYIDVNKYLQKRLDYVDL